MIHRYKKVEKERPMKKIVLIIFCIFFTPILMACNISNILVPKTITIDGITYRNGFYGDLWPENLTYKGDSYKKGNKEFYHVDCEQFDWVHSDGGGTANGVLYCAESQWEQANEYYKDSNNFTYFCSIGAEYIDRDPVIITVPNIDPTKFDELLSFAKKNSYDPFGANSDVKTFRLPIPDREESPQFIFYSESKDGFFTSFKGDKFFVVDGKLLLLYYYDYGHGKYEEMVAVEVPDELGKYFIEFIGQLTY